MHERRHSADGSIFPGLALILAGCSLGPAYHHPVSDIPPAYRATAATAAVAWPSRAWWRGFGSPELDRLIADASAYDFDIQAAIARVREADQQIRISGAPLLPSVTLNAQAQYTREGLGAGRNQHRLRQPNSRPGGKGHYIDARFYDLLPSASYELDFWGRLRATQQSAEASALFSRYDQQTVALTAVSSTATTYFTALAYEDRLAIAQRNLRDAEADPARHPRPRQRRHRLAAGRQPAGGAGRRLAGRGPRLAQSGRAGDQRPGHPGRPPAGAHRRARRAR